MCLETRGLERGFKPRRKPVLWLKTVPTADVTLAAASNKATFVCRPQRPSLFSPPGKAKRKDKKIPGAPTEIGEPGISLIQKLLS